VTPRLRIVLFLTSVVIGGGAALVLTPRPVLAATVILLGMAIAVCAFLFVALWVGVELMREGVASERRPRTGRGGL
jgi:hypothetical protein